MLYSSDRIFKLKDTTTISNYFVQIGSSKCFKSGTNATESHKIGKCVCNEKYLGRDCGIPQIIGSATIDGANITLSRFKLRSRPRRIISALPFNHEFDLLEARLHDLNNVVDVFIIQESNFTNSGGANTLKLKDKLKSRSFNGSEKIFYIERTEVPDSGFSDGVLADADMRRHLGQEGLKHVTDIRLDDLYVYNDSDEIPKAELLLFLKLYDGIPHQVSLSLIWSLYGFYWQVDPLVYGGGVRWVHSTSDLPLPHDFFKMFKKATVVFFIYLYFVHQV